MKNLTIKEALKAPELAKSWKVFKHRYRGGHSRALYYETLVKFFDITSDVYISGITEVPKKYVEDYGKKTWSSAEAYGYWQEKCKLTPELAAKYFRSVDDVHSYS